MNLQQRVEACRKTICTTCGAASGQPCVFTMDGALGIFRKGQPMKIHHDARWRATEGWPFGPMSDEEWKGVHVSADRMNAIDSQSRGEC